MTGELLPVVGIISIGIPLATDPTYRVDEAFVDFFGIGGAISVITESKIPNFRSLDPSQQDALINSSGRAI
ncbi:MAG: hypothetical protein E6R07_01450 [Nevskiaceae bacterium]|nr:MAG: hypothetical protein E6R07_01450 [Nevskiaceae bacterium]